MKFNAKGIELRDRWFRIWEACEALEIALKGEEKAEHGTSAIENYVSFKTLEDEIGYDFATYQENAIEHIFECLGGNFNLSDIYCLNTFNCRDVILAMTKYFDMSEEEEKSITKRLYPGEEETLKISKVNIKSETFCTPWNGKLYCVDICEDAEERGAWLYNASYGIKSFMFGEEVKNNRDEFLDVVFSNLPDYIGSYEEEYED